VCNVGSRPTVNSDAWDITLEVYVFDHDEDLYGKEITVSLIELLRRETKFDSLDELSAQIARDAENAKISLKKEGYTL
jgi:riboflavin kinase/FMN adenylyltransferase